MGLRGTGDSAGANVAHTKPFVCSQVSIPTPHTLPPHLHTPQDKKAEAELRFRDISEAMEVLSDGDLRARYDRGEDVTANPGQNQQQHGGHGFPGGFPFGGGGFQQFHFRQG